MIHADLYSDCHVIPVGTADLALAMKSIERLPIILTSLTTAYDLLIVECGQANASGLKRVTDAASAVFVGALEPEDEIVRKALRRLAEGGYTKALVVTPSAKLSPPSPKGQSRAA